MAGIAFRLQKLLKGESYSDLVRAYLYSAVIASGPFLVVILTLGALHFVLSDDMNNEDSALFRGLIVYAYAFSMIGVAPFLYVITRYLADRYYLKEAEFFTPTFLTALEVIFLVQGIAGGAYLWFLPILTAVKIAVFVLYLLFSGIWIAMIFLSAARDYLWIVGAFAVGGVASVGIAFGLGQYAGLIGHMTGFTAGQALCFFLLTLRIFNEFGYTRAHDYGLFLYFKKHPALVVIGIFYYLGIWIDKALFWFSEQGHTIVKGLQLSPIYDTPLFLAYLTVVPSMAFFLAQMETSFVKYYNAYYKAVRERAPLNVIRRRCQAMSDDVTRQFLRFVVLQGAISGFIILFLYQIADTFHLNPAEMGVFRIALLGAFLQMGFLMVVNLLFYFDLQRDLAKLCILFFVTNTVFTAFSLSWGSASYGFGFASATFVSFFAAFLTLDKRLDELDYLTFMKQPIFIPKFKLEAESK
jgi:uncharacterized membrane protein